jgi:CDP-diacylglycerol---serine O-phosphatidyltransferase
MNIKKHIPNIITLLNLFCGCIAIVFISQYRFDLAFYFVCLGIFFDFFDGFFARKFGVAGPLGVQLDSLADMVTSGVAPGFVMYKVLLMIDNPNQLHLVISPEYSKNFEISFLPFLGFIITLGACYRLANFNIDTRQTDSFIGLPTPANALFILSIPIINIGFPDKNVTMWILIAITLISAYIMNAEIPLFSLKVKDFSFKKNALQILFLASSVLLILVFGYLGIPMVIVFYVLLSVANNLFSKK